MSQPGFLTLIGFGPQGWGAILLVGALVTIAAALCGLVLGLAIGAVGAWAKISGTVGLRRIADVYTTTLRGVPDLLVIYLFYFGSTSALTAISHLYDSQGYLSFPGFLAGALAIGAMAGAQATEALRGAFYAIEKGELDAARACGMTTLLRFRRIIAPLVLRHALPALGNIWLNLLKESSLLSVTGVAELMREAQVGAGSTRRPFDFYITAGGLYIVMALVSSLFAQLAERRYSRGVVRT